jgi:cell division protein FtsW
MAALVMAQPDMGTTLILACIVLSSLYVAGIGLMPLTSVVVLGAATALMLAKAAPYRWRRITAFWHPFSDASNAGYQSAQGILALGSGRLFGLGLGATRACWSSGCSSPWRWWGPGWRAGRRIVSAASWRPG